MTVETATDITELDATLPAAGDYVKEGDDHLRLLKTVLKAAHLVLQFFEASYATYASTTSVIAGDNTIPQSSEGTEIMTLAITPKSATSKLRITATVLGTCSTSNNAPVVALFKDSDTDAIAAAVSGSDNQGPDEGMNGPLIHVMDSPGTSEITFKLRVGPSATGTFYINGHHNGGTPEGLFSTVGKCVMTVEEIQQ